MKSWFCRFLILCLLALLALSACDEDDVGSPTQPVVTAPDITSFVGAWKIHRSGAVQFLGCSTPCREQLQRLLDAYFEFPADTACVRVDTLTDLILVEPFASSGEISGSVVDGIPLLDCEHTGELGGDSLATTLSVELLVIEQFQQSVQTFLADYRVSVEALDGDECGGCNALLGITGNRLLSGDCGP